MLLAMVADMPEVIDDIRSWRFRTYQEHFSESGLSFGPLAIEAYSFVPEDVRQHFESLILELRQVIAAASEDLEVAKNKNELSRLKLSANQYSIRLQSLIETGSGIIHGVDLKSNQAAIDEMF